MTAEVAERGEAGRTPLLAALASTADALGQAAAVPSWQLAQGDVRDGLAQLDLLSRLVAAQSVRLLAEAEHRGLPAQGGHRHLSHWLRELLPATTRGEAARLAGLAEILHSSPTAAHLEPTRAAFLAGEVSAGQADVLAATVTAVLPPTVPAGTVDPVVVAGAQTFLLDQARVHDATGLRRLSQHLVARLDPDADDRLARDEHARDRARSLTLSRLRSGMVHVEGLLTPRCGAAFTTAIDAWSAPHPAADGTPDPRTAAQRRHDAVQQLAEAAIAVPGQLPSSHRTPYRVVVTVEHPTLAAALAGASAAGLAPALLPDGTQLSAGSVAEIACGADLVPVLVDDVGNPLDVGDTQYAFPPKQRTAIVLRDGHCTWPGCTAPPPWCDLHHLVPFSRGGPTAVTNGALLCGRHHRHVHATGQTGRLVDGTVLWSSSSHGPPSRGGAVGARAEDDVTRATRALDHLVRRWLARRRQ